MIGGVSRHMFPRLPEVPHLHVNRPLELLSQYGLFLFVIIDLHSGDTNRPFPSSKKPHFQNEAQCETFVVKINFICIIIENHFHINGFALSLALKVRFFGTRKWPITRDYYF